MSEAASLLLKYRLVVGTINAWPDEDGWRTWTLDIADRGIWDRDLQMAVLPDFVESITNLEMFRPTMFDEVRAHHILEHLSLEDGLAALAQIHRILKVGGVLDVEVPDVARVCLAWTREELDDDGLRQWLYGEQLPNHLPGDSHRYAWMERELAAALDEEGFDAYDRLETGLALRFRAVKRKEDA